ncbi:hypothetical protein [Niveispirillum irakense]|uniref:hypothetical protein n=1 Tax=Niveispirillum irakense TaxID=34011 RepID=UPI00040E2037|nr:hypothetical protein [Niveispirillum irakense]
MTGTAHYDENMVTLRDAIFADPALVDRLSGIEDRDVLAQEVLSFASANGINVDIEALRGTLDEAIDNMRSSELSDEDLENVAAGMLVPSYSKQSPKGERITIG